MKRVFCFKAVLLVILAQFTLVACANESSSSNPRITFPLLAECKSSVKGYLNQMPDMAGLSFRVIEFDQTIESHPAVVGYVEMETEIDSKDGLVSIFNAIKSKCYPETSTTVAINENLGREVSELLNINRRMGVDNTYIVVEGDSLKAYYHDK